MSELIAISTYKMHFAKKCVCVIASVIVLLAIVYHSMNPIQSYNQVNFKDVGPYYSFGPENSGMYLMAQKHAGQGLNPNNMQFLETFTERQTPPVTSRPARTTVARTTRPARTTVPITTRPARTKPQTTYAWSTDSYSYSPDHPPSTFSQDQPTYSYAHIL